MKKFISSVLIALIAACSCTAVTSKIVRHKTIDDFSKGTANNTVITSRGTISLAAATQTLAEDFNGVWTINSIVCKDDTIYVGTSPNGQIYKYKNGKITLIYPQEKPVVETNEPNKPKNAPAGKHLTNEHIFRLALDADGNLLAGVSGEKSRLLRFDGKRFETIFEPNLADPNGKSLYIFAITLDKAGSIFLGTGPKGQIWRLDRKGRNPQLVYTCQDKNVLCLAFGKDGFLYAGTDTRGLIYKINPETKTASVLYDSGENEITDLLFDGSGNLYAAATSYKSIAAQLKGASQSKQPLALGKPETPSPQEPDEESTAGKSESLKIANTPKGNHSAGTPAPAELERGKPSSASHIYKIDPNGFVTDIFSRAAVFFSLYMQKDQILLGTGNKAQLFSVSPKTETETMVYEDKQSSQITEIKKFGNEVVFSTANPPKLIKLKSTFAQTGDYQSALVDAGQPAQWGKLQLEADIPADTKILLSARSGNVEDVNDPTFSAWTVPVRITSPVDLAVPLARFCQYKLILNGTDTATPVVREAAAAFVIPNLAPKITEISTNKADDKNANSGAYKIDFKADDENGDELIYQIDFRKKGRLGWIKMTDELEKTTFDWNSKTVEDGIYEIRVVASDELSNNQNTKLTGSRVSEPVTVDNTAPVIEKHQLQTTGQSAVLTLKVIDEFSTIDGVSYAIDSNEKWIAVLPDDNVFDTITENFTIKIEDLTPGQHVIAVKISDAENNTMYKTYDVDIK